MDLIRVGAFDLYPSERQLRAGGKRVELGARAFDLLLVLAENPGRLVTKATLLERVWPRLVVDENNLPAQIAALRRVLGAECHPHRARLRLPAGAGSAGRRGGATARPRLRRRARLSPAAAARSGRSGWRHSSGATPNCGRCKRRSRAGVW